MTEGSETVEHTSQKTSKLPGGEYRPKPIQIGGEFYDPFHPPKQLRRPDGTLGYIGGERLNKDQVYADQFWQSSKATKGTREVMIGNIRKAAGRGFLGSFVDPSGISEEDKEKLSAYRQLAKELGYEVGDFTFNKEAGTATAPIRKASTQQK